MTISSMRRLAAVIFCFALMLGCKGADDPSAGQDRDKELSFMSIGSFSVTFIP